MPHAYIVTAPGKYEGEPAFVPMFWETVALCGCAEDREENGVLVSYCSIESCDVELFPELKGWDFIRLYEDEQGFVHHTLLNALPEE